jgi:hypothetical protein
LAKGTFNSILKQAGLKERKSWNTQLS